jgi:dolichyl-phosphate-mannose--protein O-mannosyl transferase
VSFAETDPPCFAVLSPEIRYYDTIAFRHKETNAFLHSHVDRYPLRYDDGRVSSQGTHLFPYWLVQIYGANNGPLFNFIDS